MITYNNDHTYNLSAMTKKERDNYDEAYTDIKDRMYNGSAPREAVEAYIKEKEITDGYEYWEENETNNFNRIF